MRKLSLEELNDRLKKIYPNDNVEFIFYQNMKSKCQIKCNNCKTIYDMCSAESVFKKKFYFCPECNDTPDWKATKNTFLKWLSEHNEFELVDDLEQIHNSQQHIKCKCTKCGLVQENKKVYDYFNGKKCFCETKSVKKPKIILDKEMKEKGYELLEEYINTDTPIKVRRKQCGHIFKARVAHILKDKYYCPFCNMSKGEETIKDYFLDNNINFIHQYKINTYKVCYIDFYLPDYNIFVEFNGGQHYFPVKYFGGEDKFKEQQKRDSSVKKYCKENKIRLIEIPYWDFKNISGILKEEIGYAC